MLRQLVIFGVLFGGGWMICYPKIPEIDLTPAQYNGSWFVIARKPSKVRYFLPKNLTSSTISLILQPDNTTLSFTEYHMVDDKCETLTGEMKENEKGYILNVNRTSGDFVEKLYLRPMYHGYSGEQNEEMNMVLYGCLDGIKNGGCKVGDEVVLIMSNSRHPQTLQLFKSAKIIEDEACIDILQFNALDTYTNCGDIAVDEDQKLRHAKIDEDKTFVDVECRYENLNPKPNNITGFFKEPRILTVVAYIDPIMSGEQIAHISCRYDTEYTAECEWIRQDQCFKTSLEQKVKNGKEVEIKSTMLKKNGTSVDINWSGKVLWENGDEYISVECLAIADDGACDSYRVYVWSDEDHMDQPTIAQIYQELQSVCIDPTDLIFLNTFHECMEPSTHTSKNQCSVQNGWSPITVGMLQGVWYIAAENVGNHKLILKSSVIELKINEHLNNTLDLIYYAGTEPRENRPSVCVGPGIGKVTLLTNGSIGVTYDIVYSNGFKYTVNTTHDILYLDNQRAVLNWCYHQNETTGECSQRDVTFMIRTRHFSHNDLSMVEPYLENVCTDKKSLRWLDLHSQCGMEISKSTLLRRELITLTHFHVLDILTNVQEPNCTYREIRGVKADLLSLERAGTWYLMSLMDEMSMDTYAMVGRLYTVTNTTAVLRLFQSAAYPGKPRNCFTRAFTIQEKQNATDFWYELHFESTTKISTLMIFRFLFFNKQVGVIYSCLENYADGKCKEKAIYVISRHETIDNAELTVLEKVAKSVCIDPENLYHTGAQDECIVDLSRLKPPACSSIDLANSNAEWFEMNLQQIETTYSKFNYHVVASSNPNQTTFSIKFDGQNFQRITEQDGGCLSSPVKSIKFSSRNRNLIMLSDQIILIHIAGVRSDLLLREAQMSGVLPCLHTLPQSNNSNVICTLHKMPDCHKNSGSVIDTSLIDTSVEYNLYASDPYFVRQYRCKFEKNYDDEFLYTCNSQDWNFGCEDPSKGVLNIFKNGSFVTIPNKEVAPIRVPESEIFERGNITITNDMILMVNNEHLVGTAYSIWLKKDLIWNEKMAEVVEKSCVWVLDAQKREEKKNDDSQSTSCF
ncbi:unnamed protein product [Caenorhabditis angaria]|uniref:Uncharacterized protein n=1 Tax=Caenorhabditis angaria TaxID=860376 RepID=A0A9P1IM93_9PELO|nr:unnamed protein product [Caenorhabditis angaria]